MAVPLFPELVLPCGKLSLDPGFQPGSWFGLRQQNGVWVTACPGEAGMDRKDLEVYQPEPMSAQTAR